jgi:hypothetical protein
MVYTFSWVPTPGQNNSFVTNNNGTGRAIVNAQQSPFNSPLYVCIPPITFQGGSSGAATLYDFAKLIATCGQTFTVQTPVLNYNGNQLSTGGALTINGNPCGNYEYNVLPGGTTLTQTSIATLFSSTLDISTWIVVQGNLTLDSNTTLIPTLSTSYSKNITSTVADPLALRRLFMVVYVKGNLSFSSNSSCISMSACGGNSDTTGANITSFQIPVASLASGTVTPSIAAAGTAVTVPGTSTSFGIIGPAGTQSGDTYSTGGGGSGYIVTTEGNTRLPGRGGVGSCFSGGTGGGTATNTSTTNGTSGSSLGGAGGNTTSTGSGDSGGTGNPGGAGRSTGNSGTGGILIVITEGTSSQNANRFAANGVDTLSTVSGGASGGGIVLQLYGSGSAVNTIVSGGQGFGYSAAGGGGSSGSYQIT